MHLDNLLEHLNPYGPFQILSWLVLSVFTCFPPAWHQFAITFTAYRPSEFGCAGFNTTLAAHSVNGSTLNPVLARHAVNGHPCLYTLAHYSDNSSDAVLLSAKNETCSSDFWYSESDPVTSTIITQWDLVCEREYLQELISTAEGTGEVIGCIIFGFIADRFGRKVGFFGSAAALFASGLLCAFATHPALAVIARLIIGIALTGMNNIGFLMNAELFTPNARTFFSTGGELMWGLAVVSLAGIGFGVRDSFWFMIAITVPVGLIIPFWWLINESLHWNLSKGHIERAKESLRRIARFNNVTLDEKFVQQVLEEDVAHERELLHSREHSRRSSSAAGTHNLVVQSSHTKTTPANNASQHLLSADSASTTTPAVVSGQHIASPVKTSLPSSAVSFSTSSLSRGLSRASSASTLSGSGGGVLDLFRTPKIRMITISLTLLWFANTMCYYGLQLAAQDIAGVDFYLSFFILAVVEVPSVFAIMPTLHYLGRRWTIIAFQLIGGISIIAVSFVPPGNELWVIAVAAFGKFTVCASFTSLYVYAVELYPTIIRGTGFGVVSVIGRVGMIVAPLVNSLGYGESASSVPPWLRNVIYGASIILTGFLTLPLPETNHHPLADTIEEMENYAEYCRNYHKANGEATITNRASDHHHHNHVVSVDDGSDEEM